MKQPKAYSSKSYRSPLLVVKLREIDTNDVTHLCDSQLVYLVPVACIFERCLRRLSLLFVFFREF